MPPSKRTWALEGNDEPHHAPRTAGLHLSRGIVRSDGRDGRNRRPARWIQQPSRPVPPVRRRLRSRPRGVLRSDGLGPDRRPSGRPAAFPRPESFHLDLDAALRRVHARHAPEERCRRLRRFDKL